MSLDHHGYGGACYGSYGLLSKLWSTLVPLNIKCRNILCGQKGSRILTVHFGILERAPCFGASASGAAGGGGGGAVAVGRVGFRDEPLTLNFCLGLGFRVDFSGAMWGYWEKFISPQEEIAFGPCSDAACLGPGNKHSHRLLGGLHWKVELPFS